ncbi:Solute carrier family 26 member 10 [Collichthys lucidus]|uniref:Solute carrier family 26 member 10 n=1 Tax=Collichthys lucidus TaxID=240159 RepID=A0A4U5UR71_COLLU|nr:Solute carrier family 26 member 10 [Collichthys lucidus]
MSASVAVYRNVYTEDRFKQAYGSDDDARGSMAFALLTSVAPIFGLYTSFFPVVLYMFFGTGRHVSTGTFAVVSLMTGSVVEQLVPTPLEMNSSSSETAEFEAQRIGVASAVALLSGIIMLCMFGLQLGFLSTYLSEPIVKAFTSAAAFHVTISQLQSMLGLRLPRHTGTFSLFKTLASVMKNLPHTNMAELLISMVCLAVLVPVKEINMRYRQRLRTPIPVEILTVILATGVAYASSLDSTYNIEIVGHIPAGFPRPRMPALHTLPEIAGDTVAITFVGYAVSVSLAMIYADKHGYSIHPNQELLAHGVSNTVSSFFTCFPSSATLATTNILESAGGHTQLSGLFTSLVVLIVLLLIGPLFYFLPKMVWVVTWLSVVVLNVDLGLAIGVVFSMMTVICRTQRAGCSVLGRASNTEIYRPLENHSKCYEVPGVKILTYNGPIYYGNRNFFREEMSRLLGLTPEKIRSREKARKALEKREREASVNTVV